MRFATAIVAQSAGHEEPGKHQAINVAESHSLGRSAMQHIELVSKEQDFSMQRSPRPEWCEDRRPHQPAKIAHQNEVSTDSQTIVSRFQFAVGTGGTKCNGCLRRRKT